jgi:hypothetical protein
MQFVQLRLAFLSRFRLRKGRSDMTGRMMSDTREFAQAEKAAARLWRCQYAGLKMH